MRADAALVVTLLSASVALAQGGIELESFLWRPDLTATVRSVAGDASADPGLTTLDLKGDLGMQDDDAFDTRLTFHIGPRSRVRLAWVDLDTTGDERLARTVEFDGRTYVAGTRVVSAMRIDYGRVGWIWEFAGTERVRLGTVVEAKWVEIDTTLDAVDLVPPVDGADSLSALLPAAGLALDVAPGQLLGLFAEVTGIAAGDRGHVVDGEVGVRLTPTPYLTLVGGYRTLDVRIEDDGDLADFEDAGPYLGLQLQF
jgi:hypothetical protein